MNRTALAAMSDEEQSGHPELVAQLRLNVLGFATRARATRAEFEAIARLAEVHGLREQAADVALLRGCVALARGELATAESFYRFAADEHEALGQSCAKRRLEALRRVASLQYPGSGRRPICADARPGGCAPWWEHDRDQRPRSLSRRRVGAAWGVRPGDRGPSPSSAGSAASTRIVRAWVAELAGESGRALELVEAEGIRGPSRVSAPGSPGARARLSLRAGEEQAALAALAAWERSLQGDQSSPLSAWSAIVSADEAAVRLGTDELVRELYERLAGQPMLRMTCLRHAGSLPRTTRTPA